MTVFFEPTPIDLATLVAVLFFPPIICNSSYIKRTHEMLVRPFYIGIILASLWGAVPNTIAPIEIYLLEAPLKGYITAVHLWWQGLRNVEEQRRGLHCGVEIGFFILFILKTCTLSYCQECTYSWVKHSSCDQRNDSLRYKYQHHWRNAYRQLYYHRCYLTNIPTHL